MRINLSFDASVSNASSRWIESVEQAANFLDAIISDPITVNFQIGYGEVEGQELGAGVLGATSNDIGYNVSYGQLVAALEKHPTSLLDQQFLSTLPQVDPNNGQTWFVPSAEAKALGLSRQHRIQSMPMSDLPTRSPCTTTPTAPVSRATAPT
jgi:hypothetical protein